MLLFLAIFLGLAYWLYRYFVTSDRGAKEPKSALRAACLFGILAIIIVPELYSIYLPVELILYLQTGAPLASQSVLLQGSLLIGLTEELVKFLPLAFWIFNKKYFNETTDGIIYFGLCGMWFGAVENIQYLFSYGTEVGFSRLIFTPFLHAGLSALIGWGLAKYKLKQAHFGFMISLLVFSILLHALYDYVLFTGTPVFVIIGMAISVALNLCVFFLFRHARREDERLGLSSVGINDYCRHCGAVNDKSFIYCTNCGNKT